MLCPQTVLGPVVEGPTRGWGGMENVHVGEGVQAQHYVHTHVSIKEVD